MILAPILAAMLTMWAAPSAQVTGVATNSSSPLAINEVAAGSRVFPSAPVPTATGYKAYWRIVAGGAWNGPFVSMASYYPETIPGELRHDGNVILVRHLEMTAGQTVEICMTAFNDHGESPCSESIFVVWPDYLELWHVEAP